MEIKMRKTAILGDLEPGESTVCTSLKMRFHPFVLVLFSLLLSFLLLGCGGGDDGVFTTPGAENGEQPGSPGSGQEPEPPPEVRFLSGPVELALGSTTQYAVVLDRPASGDVIVNLASSGDTTQILVPGSVTIPGGGSSAVFDIQAPASASLGAQVTISLAAGTGYTRGSPSEATITLVDSGVRPVDSVVLLTSSPDLPSSGLEPVTLTAFVRDGNNNLIEGARVVFNATQGDGTVLVTRAETDATGSAQAQLSVGNNKLDRRMTVTATSGDREDQVDVSVTGTGFSLVSGRTSGLAGDVVNLTLVLRDSEGNRIVGQPLAVSFPEGTLLSDANPVSNSSGQVTVQLLLGAESGTLRLEASRSAGGFVSGDFPINVSTDNFAFVDPGPEPRPEVELDTPQILTLRWTDSTTEVPLENRQVTFTTTRGNFVDGNVVMTDANGEATVTIEAGTAGAGPAVITATATADDGTAIAADLGILFVATEVRSMTLQADPAVIGPNPAGETSQQSTIVAILRDSDPGQAGNRVKGKRVDFTLTDVTGGSLSSSSAVSDEFGRAVITYTAGAVSSAQNAVVISAAVADTPAVNREVRLTVARRSLFITLGTGNVMEKPDAVRYIKPYGVLVTDSTGNPVSNVDVTLEIWPTHYLKGKWERLFGADGAFLRWIPVGVDYPGGPQNAPFRCRNLDEDRDGIRDEISDGPPLIPGNAVTLSTLNVTTDSSGFADFAVLYFQQFAQWLDVELTARARVDGTESREQAFFRLPILGDDITDENVEPPGNPSPFGQVAFCGLDKDTDVEEPPVAPPVAILSGTNTTIGTGDTVTLSVTISPETQNEITLNMLATGLNIDRFEVGGVVPGPQGIISIPASGNFTQFTVEALAGAKSGDFVDLQLTSGSGYVLSGITSNIISISVGDGSGVRDDVEPVSLSGTGPDVVSFEVLTGGAVFFELTHSGQSNFIVVLRNNNGERLSGLVNVIGGFDGTRVEPLDAGTYLLDIQADGAWEVSFGLGGEDP